MNITLDGNLSRIELLLTDVSEELALELAQKINDHLKGLDEFTPSLEALARKIGIENRDSKLRAVKLFKEQTGLDLRTSKEYMDNVLIKWSID